MRKQKTMPQKTLKPSILLVCDDKTGGLEYLKLFIKDCFPNHTYKNGISLSPKIKKPDLASKDICSSHKEAWDKYKKNHAMFLIFADGDTLQGYRKENIKKFETLCNANSKIKFILNTPSIETWYVCHYEQPKRSDIIEQLKKHIPNYEKSYNPFEDINKHKDTAIKHANALCINASKAECSLWTDMYTLYTLSKINRSS